MFQIKAKTQVKLSYVFQYLFLVDLIPRCLYRNNASILRRDIQNIAQSKKQILTDCCHSDGIFCVIFHESGKKICRLVQALQGLYLSKKENFVTEAEKNDLSCYMILNIIPGQNFKSFILIAINTLFLQACCNRALLKFAFIQKKFYEPKRTFSFR